MFGYVYILKSLKNGHYYIGSTINVEKRLIEHNSGKSKFTSESRPYVLLFNQQFNCIKEARQIEFKLKQLKNRKITEQIIQKGKLFINDKGNINW